MIRYIIIFIIIIFVFYFYRSLKYKSYLKELNHEHFSINKNKKKNKKLENKVIPSNPSIVFCDYYGNINIIKDNKVWIVNKNKIIKNGENINEIFKIPYSLNIKTGTIFKKYLLLVTTNNEIIEYDIVENKLKTLTINDYFKNIDFEFEKMLYIDNSFIFFNKNTYYKYDLYKNKFVESNNIKHIFKNYPEGFSCVFLNNNILFKNIPYGAPCFYRNKDLFIYDLNKKDCFYTNLENGFISNTDYSLINYSESKVKYTPDKSGYYRIFCVGGGLESGGYGGLVFNDFNLTKKNSLEICVGGSGERLPLKDSIIVHDKLPYTLSSAGSGGTFIYKDNELLLCAGGGGGWSSEIIKAPKICNSSFKHQRIFNKLVVPIKKIVLTTKSSSYHKNNNIKQKLIIKDFMLNVHNDNSVEYDVIQTPQLNNKVHKYETSYNNINSNSSISFIFNNPISDYDFKMNVSVLSTNNDNNNCDLELYDERNRKIIIEDFNIKVNNTKLNSRKIINLFSKYPNTLNNFYVSGGNKSSKKYDDLFENVGPNSLDYPLIKLNGGIGGGGYSYLNKSRHITTAGGGGGYKGGDYCGINDDEYEKISKLIKLDYVCGIGGLSFIKNKKYNDCNYINDFNNKHGIVIIIKINPLQSLGKVEDDSYLQSKKKKNLFDPIKVFYKNNNKKDIKHLDITIPSINNDIRFDTQNYKFFQINNKIKVGVNHFKVKIDKRFDKLKMYIESNSFVELMIMYFSTKTLNRILVKGNMKKNDNILSLNHELINPSLINIFSFIETLLKNNIYMFNGKLSNFLKKKKKNNQINKETKLFDKREFVYDKSKKIILDLDTKLINEVDYLYILVNSFNDSNIKINLVEYNSNNKNINNSTIEYTLKNI